jgi:hypothetical protein
MQVHSADGLRKVSVLEEQSGFSYVMLASVLTSFDPHWPLLHSTLYFILNVSSEIVGKVQVILLPTALAVPLPVGSSTMLPPTMLKASATISITTAFLPPGEIKVAILL